MINDKNSLIIYYFFSTLFIYLTTNFLSEYDLVNTFGQKDIEQYFMIAKAVPGLPESNPNILAHVSTRYFIPYVAGLISYLSNVYIFDTYKFLNFIFLIFFIFSINKLLNKLHININGKFIFFSLIFLNPYLIRQHVFNPVITHDLLFFSLTIFFLIGVLEKKFTYILIPALIMIFIRQSSIAFFIGGIVFFLLEKNYKKLFIYTFLFLSFFYLNDSIGSTISPNTFDLEYAYGIFTYKDSLDKLIRFLLMPLISFFPLIFLMIFSRKFKDNININLIITLLIISILLIGQPVLGGPEWTQRNVVRISTLSYVVSTLFLFETFDLSKLYKKRLFFYFFIVGLFFWSFHPLYSKFKFFDVLRF
jgi:hypothetical protein